MDERTEESLLPKAKKGDKDAQHRLGHYYDWGIRLGFDFNDIDGVPADVYWYNKAAENGHSEAQYTLGQYFRFGISVPRDSTQSRYWFSKAAAQGHKKAQGKVEKQKAKK